MKFRKTTLDIVELSCTVSELENLKIFTIFGQWLRKSGQLKQNKESERIYIFFSFLLCDLKENILCDQYFISVLQSVPSSMKTRKLSGNIIYLNLKFSHNQQVGSNIEPIGKKREFIFKGANPEFVLCTRLYCRGFTCIIVRHI